MNKNVLWLGAAVAVLVGMLVWRDPFDWFPWPEGTCIAEPCQPTSPATAARTDGRPINISIASSITKREWLDAAIPAFNEASKSDSSLQVNGKPIVVTEVKEEDALAPGTFKPYRSPTQARDTRDGKIMPTILSPADEAWVLWLNREWRATHGGQEIVTAKAQSVAQTPIVIAMWRSRAQALGCWPSPTPECTWARFRTLAARAEGWGLFGHPEWGQFKFGYAYVGESDVGTQTAVMVCMMGLHKTTGLTVADIDGNNGCGQAIVDVEKAKVRSGTSSPWLLDGMVQSGLDAVTTYEKEVVAYNIKNRQTLREPLVAVYPQDGTVVAGHPFAILDRAPWVTADQVEAAKVFQAFLLSSEWQRRLLETGMRPADPGVKLGSPIELGNGANPDGNLVRLEVPETLVLNRIIEVWQQVKKPAVIALVFDKSGSMNGEKITAASKGAIAFVNAMYGKDWLLWMPFDDQVFVGVQGPKAESGERLVGDIAATPASGGTALYDAVGQAFTMLSDMRSQRGKDPARYGIVVLSDGRDTNSTSYTLSVLEARLRPLEQDPSGIQIHTVGIGGDVDDTILAKIAAAAHGKYWKAKTTSVREMELIYQEIVKYW
ncbi:MAG: VWA domain-containing protein [Chloroflexi bacterium]|nr:VWA domain-containing protein [Chloroflexota bacterium]